MIAYDKKLHIIVGFIISLIGYYLFASLLAGFVLAVVAGILKETIVKVTGKGTPEGLDILATAAGGSIPTVTVSIYYFVGRSITP